MLLLLSGQDAVDLRIVKAMRGLIVGEMKRGLTLSPVYVVEVCGTILGGPVTYLAEETRGTRTTSGLHYNALSLVFVEFEGCFTLLEQFSRLWELFPLPPWFFPWGL